MKQTPELDSIQKKMRPGVITRDGFLGNDERSLSQILAEDGAAVKRLDLDHQQIARRMLELRDRGSAGLGEFVSVPPHYEVRVDSVRGRLPCPFGDPGLFPKTNTTVRNLRIEKEITYTDLSIHMILVHGFYEGRDSFFRLDPQLLAEVLEIPAQPAPQLPG